jgi:hypothetical protein
MFESRYIFEPTSHALKLATLDANTTACGRLHEGEAAEMTGETDHKLRGDYSRMRPDYTVDQDWERTRRRARPVAPPLRAAEALVAEVRVRRVLRHARTLNFGEGIPRFDAINASWGRRRTGSWSRCRASCPTSRSSTTSPTAASR